MFSGFRCLIILLCVVAVHWPVLFEILQNFPSVLKDAELTSWTCVKVIRKCVGVYCVSGKSILLRDSIFL